MEAIKPLPDSNFINYLLDDQNVVLITTTSFIHHEFWL